MQKIVVYKKSYEKENVANFLFFILSAVFTGGVAPGNGTRFELELKEENLVITAFTVTLNDDAFIDYTKTIDCTDVLSCTLNKRKKDFIIKLKNGEDIKFYYKVDDDDIKDFYDELILKIG